MNKKTPNLLRSLSVILCAAVLAGSVVKGQCIGQNARISDNGIDSAAIRKAKNVVVSERQRVVMVSHGLEHGQVGHSEYLFPGSRPSLFLCPYYTLV